ncbi:MAG: SRPBCC family protein [Chitinophagales bacterium]|nr:SRPBCC family protein [Chitinophagales bacterium]
MPTITIITEIKAPIQRCFNLSRSIDLHQLSTCQTKEKAITGRTSGLIELDEIVTWEATHLGVRQKLTSKITAFQYPFHFRDEQIKGAFRKFVHDHFFEQKAHTTIMKDVFYFETPLGIFGKLFNCLVLRRYMENFLKKRNDFVKDVAEGNDWKQILE